LQTPPCQIYQLSKGMASVVSSLYHQEPGKIGDGATCVGITGWRRLWELGSVLLKET